MVDMRQYLSKYPKPDHVREGAIQTRIIKISEDEKYGMPVLEFENGQQLTLFEQNLMNLIKAWGPKEEDWIRREVTLELGTYPDRKTNPPTMKETVLVRPVGGAANTATTNGSGTATTPPLPPPKPPLKDEMDDEIPFDAGAES